MSRRLYIREWCSIRGISLRELARRCGGKPSPGTISRYDRGEINWSPDTLETMARALAIPPDWLMSETAAEHHALLAAWTQLDPADREIAMEMIAGLARARKKAAAPPPPQK